LIAHRLIVFGVVVCASAVALADDKPKPEDTLKKPKDKKDPTALRDLGNKLFEDGNYLGALAAYKEAYGLYPSVKILLNIGVTLNKLERSAEAANAFQKYVDALDADPATKPEIEKAIVELDKKLGVIELTITPPDAQIQINEGEWVAAPKLYRVNPGSITINARREGYVQQSKPVKIAAGEKQAIPIKLELVPEKVRIEKVFAPTEGPRSRVGAIAMEHLDIPHKGAATRVGVTFDIIDRISVQGAALLGPNYGGYVGGAFSVLTGNLRPIIAVGMPVFFSDGARYGLRGAGGIEFQINRHVSLTAELGVEYMVNPEMDIKETVFIPAVGATGRL
jgi:hypothetical protein